MGNLSRDLRYSVRSLSRTPALTATIVLTIGLGLGATTGMMTVINAVLLKPLPYAQPESLVWIYTDNPPFWFRFSVVDYRALDADHPAFSAVAVYQSSRVTITDGPSAERVLAKSVTGSYFPLLGQSAAIGRLFTPADDAHRDPIAVLTSSYWRRQYSADPGVVGRSMPIDGVPHAIVGVLGPTNGPLEHDVAVFTAERWPVPRRKGPFFTTAIGRLRPDVSRQVAVETLRATNARLFPIWRSSYQDEKADRRAFWNRALERLGALPGVESVAVADSRPPQDAGNQNNFDLEDKPTPPGQNQPISLWVAVSPAFFKTVGLALERGRLLEPRDLAEDAPNVIVVDRAWAKRFFPGEDVVGRRLREGGCSTCPWTTVVGVVGTVKFAGLDAPDDGIVYAPFFDIPSGYVVLRTAGSRSSLPGSLRQAVRELDPGLALTSVATGDELVSDSLSQPRYLSVLVGMFALAALLLSMVGIYGVMSYFVEQHTRDIGIRLALGGDPSAMRRMIVGQGLRVVALGVVAGVGVSLVSGRLMQTIVFGVSPSDLRIVLAVAAALTLAAAIACVVPARRAAALDPATVLRDS